MLEWLQVILVSALPISELRGGIPLALALGLDPFFSFFLAILGNLIPVPFLLLFLQNIEKLAKNLFFFASFYSKLILHVRRKRKLIERYGYVGLAFFVSIPLPVTGAWTGSVLAWLLGLKKIKAFAAIAAGVMIAGVIVLAGSLGFLGFLALF